MTKKIYAGERVRRLREMRGLGQAALAQAIDLSPSYLNQIENNQRPLSASAVIRLSSFFGVDPTHFADDQDYRIASELKEVLSDPLFAGDSPPDAAIRDVVRASPGVAAQFTKLYQTFRALEEEYRGLREAVGGDIGGSEATPFAYDEVRDYVQEHQNHFEALDLAAEDLSRRAGFMPSMMMEGLYRYLSESHGVETSIRDELSQRGVLWQYDSLSRRLAISSSTSPESRTFFLAHQVARLEQADNISAQVEQAGLSSPEARTLLRIGLANYFAGALMMPYRPFLAEARRTRYDIERLQQSFGASFEQVCHRLSTLQRPGNPGIPFYFVKVDMAGNMSKRSSATRFKFARFGGACPLWNVHQAFASPGRILVQLAQTPDGATYLSIARTVTAGGGAYLARPREAAVGLGCEVGYADQIVYSAGIDLKHSEAAVPIGTSCKVCDRVNCSHRAFPPIGRKLTVDVRERFSIPYSVGEVAGQ